MAAGLLIECRGQDAAALQASMEEVHRALRRSGLPFGAKASELQPLERYPFFHDAKDTKVLWDVRKVRGRRDEGGAHTSPEAV
jgi:D-lactate dehydrogenase